MKKIMHIVDSLDRGGQETLLLDLAITQKNMGFLVEIVCLFNEGLLANKAKDNGITVIALKSKNTSVINKLSELKILINDSSPDTIHTHNRRPLFMALLAKPSYANRTINTRHGNGVRGLYWSIAALFVKNIVNVSNDLLQSSNWLNRVILKYKNCVIKNGILINQQITHGDNPGRIIIVGRLNPIKNHSLALKLIKECINQNLAVSLQIVGDGSQKSTIQKQIEELELQAHVSLLGDRSDVQELLTKADIFLLTSFSEGHSIALLEACAAGLPAIVSNVGGNGEIVQNTKTGMVIALDDIAGFVSSIQTLLEDREKWLAMSKATRQWAIANASMENCAKEYVKLYEK